MTPEIKPIAYEDISVLLPFIDADGVRIHPSDEIFGAFVGESIVAVGCLRRIGQTRIRLCGAWVSPEARGKGVGSALVRRRFDGALQIPGITRIDTFAYRTKLFEELGFKIIKKFKMGTAHLVKRVE